MDSSILRKTRDLPSTTLNKPVAALAIVPLNKSLTVTARKAYNVMLHIAQREGDTGDSGFSAPLNAILRGFGVGNNISTDAKRYIDQMASTKIEWRPLSHGEQWQVNRAGQGTQQAVLPELEPELPEDELRIFHMLAEVRLYKKGGENWVTWFYPPTIKEQILGPHRWARLELEVIARLSTYTSVALYEICARYRDNPGGVTSRHPWQWWIPVLRGSEGSKQREWRKFKNEFVNPAIREINEVSDIEIELIEFKQGRAVSDVQFTVRKKPANALLKRPEPPDITNLLHAARLGIRDADAQALIDRHGEAAMAAGLAAMERYLGGATAKPIMNKAAYLKTILAGQPLTPLEPAPAQASTPMASTPRLTTDDDERQARALAAVRPEFEALGPAQQAEWVQRMRAHLVGRGGISPAIIRRLDAGQWQSPLVVAMMMRFYAEQTFGPNWVQRQAV
ncbi:MAG: RepB family plasmid replication initiator protein [Vitreoscilla sp.]|nr:RepB family plasmid replication initiator protein [Vitreoscilla sp.]